MSIEAAAKKAAEAILVGPADFHRRQFNRELQAVLPEKLMGAALEGARMVEARIVWRLRIGRFELVIRRAAE